MERTSSEKASTRGRANPMPKYSPCARRGGEREAPLRTSRWRRGRTTAGRHRARMRGALPADARPLVQAYYAHRIMGYGLQTFEVAA